MNSSSTEHGPYEYDRNSDLIGRPYQLDDPTHITGEDGALYGRYISYLENGGNPVEKDPEWFWDELASSLVVLILVFAGVVLWKVWVG